MMRLFDLIDEVLGIAYGIPYASALIVGTLACVVAVAFAVGVKVGRKHA